MIIASPFGGVNIEEIASTSPSNIYKDGVDITTGGSAQLHKLSRPIHPIASSNALGMRLSCCIGKGRHVYAHTRVGGVALCGRSQVGCGSEWRRGVCLVSPCRHEQRAGREDGATTWLLAGERQIRECIYIHVVASSAAAVWLCDILILGLTEAQCGKQHFF